MPRFFGRSQLSSETPQTADDVRSISIHLEAVHVSDILFPEFTVLGTKFVKIHFSRLLRFSLQSHVQLGNSSFSPSQLLLNDINVPVWVIL